MELVEFLQAIVEHNKIIGGYQVHLNSGNLETSRKKCVGVEFGDLYFTECRILQDTAILSFGNMNREPIEKSKDGTELFPMEINNNLYIDMDRIEAIEDLERFEDWFMFPSTKVINVYMLPENGRIDGNRNVVTIGFME